MKNFKQIYNLSNHFKGLLPSSTHSAVFITYAWIFLISMGFILFPASVYLLKNSASASSEATIHNSNQDGVAPFKNNEQTSENLFTKESTGRTLSQYYSRRQYPGSPPLIPHPLEAHGINLECLTCHAEGGWTKTLKSITPVTPHPKLVSCLQCHINPATDILFKETIWQKPAPPRLGRSYLPGAPPPIPHDLQMRTNCSVCHEGPATVVEIRMKHKSRGGCRQCHVRDYPVNLFQR
jgi:nitrate reductase (cytochrome), electron transfer subunit